MRCGDGRDRYGVSAAISVAGVSARVAMAHPESVVGLHTIHPVFPPSFDPPFIAEEQAFMAAEAAYDVSDQDYSEIMRTRPETIAAALVDSPAGFAAWIVDKYRDWMTTSLRPGTATRC